MKSFKNIKIFSLISFVLFLLMSCGNLLNYSSNEKAHLKICLQDKNAARTIAPTIEESELQDFALYIYSVSEGTKQGEWKDLESLEEASLEFITGEYVFILTAKAGDVTLSDTKRVQLLEGNNTLAFELSVSDYGTGTGNVAITLSYPGNESINGAVLSLVSMTDENKIYTGTTTSPVYSNENDKTIINFTANDIPAGVYRARTTVTVDSAKYVSYSDIVKVYSKRTSSGNYESSDFVKNGRVYTLKDLEDGHYTIDYKSIFLSEFCDTDLIKGDVVNFKINGITLDDVYGIYFILCSTDSVDDYWHQIFGGKFTEEIKAGTFFSKELSCEITETPKTVDKSLLCVDFGTEPDGTVGPKEKATVTFVADIEIEVDKTNRQAPVTISFETEEGTVTRESVTRYPGQTLSDVKADQFFDGWYDKNGNKVESVPSESITLTAKWKDSIRYEKDFSNRDCIKIPRRVLESYSDSYLVVKTDYSGSTALNKVVRFSWDEQIPDEKRDFYNSGWHSISDKQKIVDYDVYKISKMLEVANANDPNWDTYFFYDWADSTLYSHLIPLENGEADKGNYVLFVDIVKPNFAKVTIDGKSEYFWPKGYPLGAAVLADYNYKLYTDSAITTEYKGEPITDDVPLWSGKCNISFNSNGGSEKKSVMVDQNNWCYFDYLRGSANVYEASSKDGEYSKNDTYDGGYPKKENCIFAGWYTDEALTTPFAASQEEAVKLSENITLYAKWLDAKYTISFDSNGGSAVEPVRVDGVHYIGCYDYVADWDGIHYFRITLSEVSNGDDLLYWYSYKAPKKEGYEFAGWYTDRECTNEFFSYEPIYAPNSPNGYVRDKIGQLTGDITLYAKWVTMYTITFDIPVQEYNYSTETFDDVKSITLTNEDAIYINATFGSSWIIINNNITTYGNPTKTGYEFAGWYTDRGCTTPFASTRETAVTLTENITLYAKWVASRTVTFNANGGTSIYEPGEVPDGLWWYCSYNNFSDNAFSIMTAFSKDSLEWSGAGPSIPNPVKEGHVFAGWYFDEACTQPCPTSSSDAVQVTGDLTLYAKWSVPRTITFNTMGETCFVESIIIPDGSLLCYSYEFSNKFCSIRYSFPQESLNWSYVNFIVQGKDNYFTGWYFDEACTQPCPTSSSDAVQVTDDLTLYAKWSTY